MLAIGRERITRGGPCRRWGATKQASASVRGARQPSPNSPRRWRGPRLETRSRPRKGLCPWQTPQGSIPFIAEREGRAGGFGVVVQSVIMQGRLDSDLSKLGRVARVLVAD